MKDFAHYLELNNEVGFVDQVVRSIIYAHGLPGVHPSETVMFETGQMGYVLGLNANTIEILLLSPTSVNVGTRIARTGIGLKIKVSNDLLGKTITSLDFEKNLFVLEGEDKDTRPIDSSDAGFARRRRITQPLETGTSMIDLIVPLGKGQRELIIGDRKTGKSTFLLQTVRNQAKQGCICIYASIAKPQLEIHQIANFFKTYGLVEQSVLVASHSTDRPGLVFLTPYVAMTIAEYFCEQGKDVLLIMDDLTAHARYYREAMLLAKRFPGRSSYPGDVFYIHARLLERAGSFQTGTITCLPVAQSVLSDLSGYIQSNLMSMTDGHILFDSDLFDQGRRPAVNPFLSVTRVGEQTQPPLVKEVSRHLRSFLVGYEKVKQFRHFQTELGEATRTTLDMGNRLTNFLDQQVDAIVPVALNVVMYAGLWAQFWKNIPVEQMKAEMESLIEQYHKDPAYQKIIQTITSSVKNFSELTVKLNDDQSVLGDPLNAIRSKAAAATPQPIKKPVTQAPAASTPATTPATETPQTNPAPAPSTDVAPTSPTPAENPTPTETK